MGGGLVGLGFSLANPKGIDILSQINGILGALVAITGTNIEEKKKKIDDGLHGYYDVFWAGGCFLYRSWEAMIVGMIGGFITCFAMPALDKVYIDDPVGAAATHGIHILFWVCIYVYLFGFYRVDRR